MLWLVIIFAVQLKRNAKQPNAALRDTLKDADEYIFVFIIIFSTSGM